MLAVSAFWLLTANRSFLAAALAGQPPDSLATWLLALALAVLLLLLHFLLLALVATRWSLKPVLALLLLATAAASHFIDRYGVYLDPAMLRNVLRTDLGEAGELLSWNLIAHLLLYAGLPLLLLSSVRIVRRPPLRAALVRCGSMLLAAVIAATILALVFKPLSSVLRNHKEVRYLITPANYLWSAASALSEQARAAAGPRRPLATDVVVASPPGTRPTVVVLVVGETARAANWGLNGYSRQTTPELARLSVVNFPNVTSCGTDTETSLPCLFAPVGRRDYDRARIEGSESLLHLLARAGIGIHWRDNQSGCKGVCDGLPGDSVVGLNPPGQCVGKRCFDAGLLQGLDERLARARGAQLWVLHQIGNHGPAYYRRYPPAFARFTPACEDDDLSRCSRAEIVNAYDNALLYTDSLLATLIGRLQAHAERVDTAMLYVSDHGESLGENNLFLHGIPYAIAPEEQKRIPMVMWLSEGFRRSREIDSACLARRAAQPASHDHLFHTLLAWFGVHTALHAHEWDLLSACRGSSAARSLEVTPALAGQSRAG